MSVKIKEIIKLVAIGNTNTKFSFFIIISPGNLKKESLGKTKNKRPDIKKIMPRIIKNLAMFVICLKFRY